MLREVVSGESVSKDGLLQGQIRGFRSVYASAVLELFMDATPVPETLQLDFIRIRAAQAEFVAIVDRVAVLTYASNSIGLFDQSSVKEKRTVSCGGVLGDVYYHVCEECVSSSCRSSPRR